MSLLNLFPMTCHPNMRILNSLPSMKNTPKSKNKPVNKLVNHCNNNQNISVMLICKENYIHHTTIKNGLKIFNEKKEINLWFTDAFQKNKKHERWTIFTWINKTTLLPNYFFSFYDFGLRLTLVQMRHLGSGARFIGYYLHSCVKLILN